MRARSRVAIPGPSLGRHLASVSRAVPHSGGEAGGCRSLGIRTRHRFVLQYFNPIAGAQNVHPRADAMERRSGAHRVHTPAKSALKASIPLRYRARTAAVSATESEGAADTSSSAEPRTHAVSITSMSAAAPGSSRWFMVRGRGNYRGGHIAHTDRKGAGFTCLGLGDLRLPTSNQSQ